MKNTKGHFLDYSIETEEMTLKSLVEKGFSVDMASSYLMKLKIKKLSENDNDCKNEVYNQELKMPPDRMKKFKNKRGV